MISAAEPATTVLFIRMLHFRRPAKRREAGQMSRKGQATFAV